MPINCLDGVYPSEQVNVTVGVTVEKIRLIFEAKNCLDKAKAMLALNDVQAAKVFPGKQWKHCKNLFRIARRLRLQAHDGSHDDCPHCTVIRSLRHASFNLLVKVVKTEDPRSQLQAGMNYVLFG